MNGHRLGGAAVLAAAIAIALEAMSFRVSFPTDPIGPRAFPLLGAALMALGGLSLWRTEPEATQGTATPDSAVGPEVPVAGGGVPRSAPIRAGLAAVSFVAYALLLGPLGFVAATSLEFLGLAILFGGRPVQSAVAGLALSAILYALFVFGLGLPLPLGFLFS